MASDSKIIGGFRVLEEIQAGSGSQGTVYHARCEEVRLPNVPVGTEVALKVMAVQDEGKLQWRKLEKRTAELARLDHPNVVKYYGCFSEQGLFNDIHVVVQEFLHGETLKERLAKFPAGLDADEAVRVFNAALDGLIYTTACGIVHRDLKPGNIFLGDDGAVKLIDFEIAKQEGGTATASVGNIRGSFDYMAPDFTNAEFHGDVKSDVFSMGVVLHEMLSGKTPYERLEGDDKQANFAFLSRWARTLTDGTSPIRISSRIRRILAHADEVLDKALSPQREGRYEDFTAFRKGMGAIRYRDLKGGERTYRMLQFIGKGGFGEVFKARCRQTGALVAIKHLLKNSYAERFHREARIMSKLTDPCFVRLMDFFEINMDGHREAFLAMDFLDGMPGSSLRDAIRAARTGSALASADVIKAFLRYAHGLSVMHAQGIFHRDIKPSNLYYPKAHPERAAIMDLGIARDLSGTATTGQVPGTLDYMPPEVVTTENRGDAGMDIYALGLCLYEALTGKTGFPRLPAGTAGYTSFFARAKAKEAPTFDDPLVANDLELRSVLQDMTNPDAEKRLKDAARVELRLARLAASRDWIAAGDEAKTETLDMEDNETVCTVATQWANIADVAPAAAAPRSSESRIWLICAGAALAIVGAIGAAVLFGSRYLNRSRQWAEESFEVPSAVVAETPSEAVAEAANAADATEASDAAAEAANAARADELDRQRIEQELALGKMEEERRRKEDEINRQKQVLKELNDQKQAAEAARKAAEEKRLAEEKALQDTVKKREAAAQAAEAAKAKADADAEETRRRAEEAAKAYQLAAENAAKAKEQAASQTTADARRKQAEAEKALADAKAAAQQADAAKAQSEAERQRLASEASKAGEAVKNAQKEAAAARAAAETRAKEDAAKLKEEESRRAQAEAALRTAETERQRLEGEKARAESERQRLESEKAQADAERQRLAEELQRLRGAEAARKAAEEKAEAEAKAKAAADAAKAAEERRQLEEMRRQMEEERKRIAAEIQRMAEEKAAAEKAAAEKAAADEAKRRQLAEEVRQLEEAKAKAAAEERARKEAEEKRQQEEAARQKAAAAAQDDAAAEVKKILDNANFYFDSEMWKDVVMLYHQAHQKGHQLTAKERRSAQTAYESQLRDLKSMITKTKKDIRVGRTPDRSLDDLENEVRQLTEWAQAMELKAK